MLIKIRNLGNDKMPSTGAEVKSCQTIPAWVCVKDTKRNSMDDSRHHLWTKWQHRFHKWHFNNVLFVILLSIHKNGTFLWNLTVHCFLPSFLSVSFRKEKNELWEQTVNSARYKKTLWDFKMALLLTEKLHFVVGHMSVYWLNKSHFCVSQEVALYQNSLLSFCQNVIPYARLIRNQGYCSVWFMLC